MVSEVGHVQDRIRHVRYLALCEHWQSILSGHCPKARLGTHHGLDTSTTRHIPRFYPFSAVVGNLDDLVVRGFDSWKSGSGASYGFCCSYVLTGGKNGGKYSEYVLHLYKMCADYRIPNDQVMGIINLVRTVSSAGGPLVSGFLWDKDLWWVTFIVAATLKVCYDIGLLAMFLKTKLPEQDGRPREATVVDMDVGILLRENLTPPEDFSVVDDDDYVEREDSAHRKNYGEVTYDEGQAA